MELNDDEGTLTFEMDDDDDVAGTLIIVPDEHGNNVGRRGENYDRDGMEAGSFLGDVIIDNELIHAIMKRLPDDSILQLIDTKPHLAKQRSTRRTDVFGNRTNPPQFFGKLPFHVACAFDSSLNVIQKLLEIYPEAMSLPADMRENRPAATADDVQEDTSDRPWFRFWLDRTPVYVACSRQRNPNYEVISFLLEKDPTCLTGSKSSPPLLHFCCQWLMNNEPMLNLIKFVAGKCPDAVTMQDRWGNYPCYYLVPHCYSLDLIKELLPQRELAYSSKEMSGDHLLHEVVRFVDKDAKWNVPQRRIPVLQWLLQEYPEATRTVNNKGEMPLHCTLSDNVNYEDFRDPLMYLAEADPFSCIMGEKTILHLLSEHMTSFQKERNSLLPRNLSRHQARIVDFELKMIFRREGPLWSLHEQLIYEIIYPRTLPMLYDAVTDGFDNLIRDTEENHRTLPDEILWQITTFLVPKDAADVIGEIKSEYDEEGEQSRGKRASQTKLVAKRKKLRSS